MKDVFDISNFNIIQDEDNYYFFRALNKEDNKDLEDKKITKNGKIISIRTDTQRWKENHKLLKPRYDEYVENSLEQMYDHIKPKFCRCTNCISLSCDSNISIHYGRDFYKDKYIMVKIPKIELDEKIINAGVFLLNEIENAVNKVNSISNIKIKKIDEAKGQIKLANIVIEEYRLNFNIKKKYRGLKLNLEELYPLKNRFSNYKTLNKEQTFEKNKLFAKVTLLERDRELKPIIKYTKNNTNLLRTVDNAFSSLEFIHYGDIKENNIINISSKEMDDFAKKQRRGE